MADTALRAEVLSTDNLVREIYPEITGVYVDTGLEYDPAYGKPL